ncbi:MAG: hypothetical protein R2748_21275 [Bryobacterales bacterium]
MRATSCVRPRCHSVERRPRCPLTSLSSCADWHGVAPASSAPAILCRPGSTSLERLAPVFQEGLARNSRHGFEADNLYAVVSLITRCALFREESRGAHYRSDFPEPREEFRKHTVVSKGRAVSLSDL